MALKMGQIRKRGGVYWIRYYRAGVRHEESAGSNKWEVARDLLRDREGDISKGLPVSAKRSRLLFDAAAADVVNDYKINNRDTLAHIERRLKKHLTPYFGGRRMSAITTGIVRAYIAQRQDAAASNASINRELAIVKRAFKLAEMMAPKIPKLKENKARRGFFERVEFDAVVKHLPAALQPVAEFAFLTGWRLKSEILPLEWRNVDWEGREVRLDPGTTKNDEGRTYPFTAALETVLEQQRAEHDRLKAENRIVPYVFHRNGQRIRHMRKAWINACSAAGCPGRLVHDLRRTAVRELERAGVPRSAAMAMVGHKTEAIYHRYAIVERNVLKEAAAKIDARNAAGTEQGQFGESGRVARFANRR